MPVFYNALGAKRAEAVSACSVLDLEGLEGNNTG